MATVKFDRNGLEDAITEINKSKKAIQDEMNNYHYIKVPQSYTLKSNMTTFENQIEQTINNIIQLVKNIESNISSMTNAERQNESIVDSLPSTITSSTSTRAGNMIQTTNPNNTQIQFSSEDVFNQIRDIIINDKFLPKDEINYNERYRSFDKEINRKCVLNFAEQISNFIRDYYIQCGILQETADLYKQYVFDDLTTNRKTYLEEKLRYGSPFSDEDMETSAEYIVNLVQTKVQQLGQTNNTADTTDTNDATTKTTTDVATNTTEQINFTSTEQKDVFTKIKLLVGNGTTGITYTSFASQMSDYVKQYCIDHYDTDKNDAEAIRQHVYNELTTNQKEFLEEYLNKDNSDNDLKTWADYIISLVVEKTSQLTQQASTQTTTTSNTESADLWRTEDDLSSQGWTQGRFQDWNEHLKQGKEIIIITNCPVWDMNSDLKELSGGTWFNVHEQKWMYRLKEEEGRIIECAGKHFKVVSADVMNGLEDWVGSRVKTGGYLMLYFK